MKPASIAIFLTLLVLPGCATTIRETVLQPNADSVFMIKGGDVGHVDLMHILDPKGFGPGRVTKPAEEPKAETDKPQKQEESSSNDDLESAFRGFYNPGYNEPVKLRRNRVQDRIIAASNEKCRTYKGSLKAQQGHVNFFLGSLTTILAGAGAIFTRVDAARVLSGTAGISSGVRAEFNSDYFNTLTVEVITKGIDKARTDLLSQIKDYRDGEIAAYTVERAVADAIIYHTRCSLIAGLEEASKSISVADDPGLKRLNDLFKENKLKATITLGTDSSTEKKPESEKPSVKKPETKPVP